jgi:cold shock protein
LRVTGTLRTWLERGYGWLAPDNGADDAFVHASTFTRAGISDPAVGDRFEFEVVAGPKGAKAINVSRLRSNEKQREIEAAWELHRKKSTA